LSSIKNVKISYSLNSVSSSKYFQDLFVSLSTIAFFVIFWIAGVLVRVDLIVVAFTKIG
jgi:hypothetical protein